MLFLALNLGGYGINMGVKGLWIAFGVANLYLCY
jgi:hypothetical protein